MQREKHSFCCSPKHQIQIFKHWYVALVSDNSARCFFFGIFAAVDQTMFHSLCLSTATLAIGILIKQYQPMLQYTVIQYQHSHHNLCLHLPLKYAFAISLLLLHAICSYILGFCTVFYTLACCWWHSLLSYQPLDFPAVLSGTT